MKLKITLFAIFIALLLIFQQTFLMSHSASPPSGYTGASGGNGTCAASGCHTPGTGVARVTYTIKYHGNGHVVNSYFPGNVYDITVTVGGHGSSSSYSPKYGFEMKAQDASNNGKGTFATGTNTIIIGSGASEIGHSNANTTDSTWSFQWQAPAATAGTITFYLAGNYADGDLTSAGDAIVTTSFTLTPAPAVAPRAKLTLSSDTVCKNVAITFTNNTATNPAIKVYSLYYGDGNSASSYGAPPTSFTHSYTSGQTYITEFVVSTDSPMTGQYGTRDSLLDTIVVFNSLDAAFTTTNNPGCFHGYDTLKITHPISGVTYTPNYSTASPMGTATANTGYPLILPNTGSSITFSMTASGAFGCPAATANFTNTIQPCSKPHAAFALDSLPGVTPIHYCHGVTYFATDNSSIGSGNIVSWKWDFNASNLWPAPIPATATGQGPQPVLFLSNNIYVIKLTVTDVNGYKDSTSNQTITVLASCGNSIFALGYNAGSLSNPTNIQMCYGDSALFSDNSVNFGPSNYHWHWGDGTPDSYVPTIYHGWAAGSWNMWYAGQDPNTSVWDTLFATVNVGAAPPAAAGRDTLICKGQSVQIGTAAQLNSVYSWTSSPAGFTNTSSNPTVAPNDTTTYFLMASNLTGTCFNYDTVQINVDMPPTVYLTASSLGECFNNDDTIYATPTNLTYSGFNASGGGGLINSIPLSSPTEWVVSWGSLSLGNQTVSVTAKTQHGCVAAVNSVTINIHSCSPPIALFYPPNSGICTGLPIKFIDSSKGVPTNWQWNFGSGAYPSTDTARNPVVTFNSPGKHYIKLTVSNSGGSSIYLDSIIAYVAATSTFSSITPVCAGYKTILNYTGNGSSNATYTWSYPGNPPDAVSGVGQGPIYVKWNSYGTKYVSLSVTENGCPSATAQPTQITVQQNPTAKFHYNILPGTAIVTFINQSSISTSYSWSFGDGLSSALQNPPAHQYYANNTYYVTLLAQKNNCASADTQAIVINNATGIENVAQSPYGFLVYHDDTKMQLQLKWTNSNSTSKNIQLFDLKGQLIYFKNEVVTSSLDVSTNNFSSGLYFVKTTYSDGFEETRKWVKQ